VKRERRQIVFPLVRPPRRRRIVACAAVGALLLAFAVAELVSVLHHPETTYGEATYGEATYH